MRTDQLKIGSTGIPVSMLLSGILVVGGIIIWIIARIKTSGDTAVPENMRATSDDKNDPDARKKKPDKSPAAPEGDMTGFINSVIDAINEEDLEEKSSDTDDN